MSGEEGLVVSTYVHAWELVTYIQSVGEPGKWKNLQPACGKATWREVGGKAEGKDI
jgi:hypothetical protein